MPKPAVKPDPGGPSRREFLTFMVAAPVLTVGAQLLEGVAAALVKVPQPSDLTDLGTVAKAAMDPFSTNVLLSVNEDSTATLLLHRMEVGQGITTAMAMLVAEELGLQPSQVKVPLRDADPQLGTNQATLASMTIEVLYDPIRRCAAGAREALLLTAATQLNCDVGLLSIQNGVIMGPNGAHLDIGSITALAGTKPFPGIIGVPKPTAQQTVIGKPTPRIEGRAQVTGQQKYTMDLAIPGAMPTMVRRGPNVDATVAAILNQAAVAAMPGVVAVLPIPTGIAVVAETFGQAWDGVKALNVQWNPGPAAGLDSPAIEATLRGAAPGNLLVGLDKMNFEFYWEMASHSPMEVTCAIADVRGTASAEIWGGFKVPGGAQRDIAKQLGISVANTTVHCIPAGGSFGRRLYHEAALEAAQVSQALGFPIKLMWSRYDETRHGRMRPASFHRCRVVCLLGDVIAYEHHVSGGLTDTSHGLGDILTSNSTAAQFEFVEAVFNLLIRCPYNFGAVTATIVETDLKLPTATFRAPWTNVVRPVEEVIVDAIAAHLNKDPYQFRRSYLIKANTKTVLDWVATAGNWGRAMPAGCAQGIAVHEVGNTTTAWLVEVDATNPAAPRVTRAFGAVDVGHPVNPLGLQAQMMGGLTDGISTVFSAGLHIQGGLPLEATFADYHVARQKDFPVETQIHVFPSRTGIPSGCGEHGLPSAAGAVANAYARATHTPVRRFPINFPINFTPVPA
jgi:isoquinoline 1-oxidoreductase beta subunit